MITDIDLWVDSNERDINIGSKHYVTYGYPKSYYKVSHYTDELLLSLSYASMKLWHKSLLLLKVSNSKSACVAIRLHHSEQSDILSKASFYKAIKELVRYRLLLNTNQTNIYVVNIQHAHKLNSPKTYDHLDRPITNFSSRQEPVNADDLDDQDTRPLAF